MAYLDQYDLAVDTSFRKKLYIAMATAATQIAGEAQGGMTAQKYSKRQRLAREVLTTPGGWIEQFSYAVTQNAAITWGAFVAISSSTNAFPIAVTTAANHNLATGDTVRIADHVTNTNANGTWTVTVTNATVFTIPTAGNGVGGATGRIRELPLDSDIQFTVNSVWDDMAGVTGLD